MRKRRTFRKRKRGAVLQVPAGQTGITIYLEDDVLSWFRKRAHVAGDGNYRALIGLALRDHVACEREAADAEIRRERDYERARKRALRDMRAPRYLGTPAKIPWTRDELHERHSEKKAR